MKIFFRLIAIWRSIPKVLREQLIDRVTLLAYKAKDKWLSWKEARKAKKKDPFIY